MRNVLCLFAIIVIVTGCSSVPRTYIAADEATYDAIANEYLGYVQNDPSLSKWQIELRRETLKTWRQRIQAAKELNK